MSKKRIIRVFLILPLFWLGLGEIAPIADLMGMQFYVEGIESQFPN